MKIVIYTLVKYLILLILLLNIRFEAKCQQVNSVYFIENAPLRHTLNPAFQPTNHFYLSLPIIGNSSLSFGNNSISLQDAIYKSNGNTVTFLDKTGGNVDKFYNSLRSTTVARADANINLISVGYKSKDVFWSFSVNEIVDTMISLPKDLFKMLFYGTSEIDVNSFKLKKLQSDATAYTEAAIGFSKQLDKKWRVGAKLKFLYGSANLSITNSRLKLEAGFDKFAINGKGSVNYSSPLELQFPNGVNSILFSKPENIFDWVRKPSGIGTGIDIGVEYVLNEKIHLSAALTDFGFIYWKNNPQNLNYNVDYYYNGLMQFDNSAQIGSFFNSFNQVSTTNNIIDSLNTSLVNSINIGQSSKSYTTGTTAKLNIGAEYNLFENKLSIGLLSRNYFFKNTVTPEITFSLNTRPNERFNATVSYSIFDGGLNSIGTGIGWRTGFVHWLFAADYIPFEKANLSLKDLNLTSSEILIPIPYRTKSINLSVGVNLVFDKWIGQPGLHKIKRINNCNCN